MASIQSKFGKSGKKTFYVVLSILGKKKWIKAGTRQNALIIKKQLEKLETSQIIDKLNFTPNSISLKEFINKYLEYAQLHTSSGTYKRYAGILETFCTFLNMFYPKIKELAQISTEVIESYQSNRLNSFDLQAKVKGTSNGSHKKIRLPKPQTVNFEVVVLNIAFVWAQERDYIVECPTKKIKKIRVLERKKACILTPEESSRFLDKCRELSRKRKRYVRYLYVFQFLLNSGLRSGEICYLTWDDIDFEKGTIKIQAKEGWKPKTRAREFFYNRTCSIILEKLKGVDEYWVFTTIEGKQFTRDMLRNALIRIAKLADLPQLTRVHDLRHTYRYYLQIKGVDRATAGEIIGHEDEKTTKIYSHTYAEHMKKVANLVDVK